MQLDDGNFESFALGAWGVVIKQPYFGESKGHDFLKVP